MAVIYEWDRNKAKANLSKHGISFTAAAKALDDPYRLEELDLGGDHGEDRNLVLCCHQGMMVVLFVVTTEPEEGVCRIMPAGLIDMSKSVTGKIVRHHRDSLPPDDTDWARVGAMTDDEITAAAKADPDAQPLTPQQLARMRRAPDPSQPKRKRGARSAPSSAPGFHEEDGARYDAGPAKGRKR